MFSKKTKTKQEKQQNIQTKNKNIYPLAAFMALIVAIVLYFVMLHVEKTALSDYEKGTVYITKTDIPLNQLITEENADNFFTEITLNKKNIPADAIIEKSLLYGKIPCFDMDDGIIITDGMFRNINEYVASMEDPRIASIIVNDFSQIAGGIIRAGDTIDIYVIEKEKEKSETAIDLEQEKPAFSDVYVMEAFDSAGVIIENSDKTSICQMVNILYESEEVYDLYRELEKGTVYIVKHIDAAE